MCLLLNRRETFRVAEPFFFSNGWSQSCFGRTLEPCVIIAGRCENARDTIKTDYMTVNAAGSTNDGGAVAAVYSVTDNGGLHRAVNRLTEKMRDMRMELRCLGDENQKLKARVSSRAMDEEATLSLKEGASVSVGVEDASHVSLIVLGEDAHLRGNSSTVICIHQEWMCMVIKTHTLLCLLQDAAPTPVLIDGTAMRMIRESGESPSAATKKKTDCS